MRTLLLLPTAAVLGQQFQAAVSNPQGFAPQPTQAQGATQAQPAQAQQPQVQQSEHTNPSRALRSEAEVSAQGNVNVQVASAAGGAAKVQEHPPQVQPTQAALSAAISEQLRVQPVSSLQKESSGVPTPTNLQGFNAVNEASIKPSVSSGQTSFAQSGQLLQAQQALQQQQAAQQAFQQQQQLQHEQEVLQQQYVQLYRQQLAQQQVQQQRGASGFAEIGAGSGFSAQSYEPQGVVNQQRQQQQVQQPGQQPVQSQYQQQVPQYSFQQATPQQQPVAPQQLLASQLTNQIRDPNAGGQFSQPAQQVPQNLAARQQQSQIQQQAAQGKEAPAAGTAAAHDDRQPNRSKCDVDELQGAWGACGVVNWSSAKPASASPSQTPNQYWASQVSDENLCAAPCMLMQELCQDLGVLAVKRSKLETPCDKDYLRVDANTIQMNNAVAKGISGAVMAAVLMLLW